MRTILLIIAALAAPAISRITMLWLTVPLAKVFPGRSKLLAPWLSVGFVGWSFRPPPDSDGLYWGVWIWYLVVLGFGSLMSSLAIFGGLIDAANRARAEAMVPPGPAASSERSPPDPTAVRR